AEHGRQAPLMEAHSPARPALARPALARPALARPGPALDRLLVRVALLVAPVWITGLVLEQPGQRVPGQALVVAEVAPGDQVAVGVAREPLAAPAQQLGNLVSPDPVVLVVIEHGQQPAPLLQP